MLPAAVTATEKRAWMSRVRAVLGRKKRFQKQESLPRTETGAKRFVFCICPLASSFGFILSP